MSDRFDAQIRAFVVELLNDPPEAPPFPHPDMVVIKGDRSIRREPMNGTQTTQPATRSSKWWRGPRVAVGAFAAVVVVAIAAVTFMAFTSGDEEGLIAGLPPGPLDVYVAALQANDADAALAVIEDDVVDGFTPYMVALDTSGVEFTDCSADGTRVRCTTTLGPNWFFNRISGNDMTSVFSAQIEGGKLTRTFWPAPAGADRAESEFVQWVREAHPELYDVMYIPGRGAQFSAEAGAIRTELVEEYLASR